MKFELKAMYSFLISHTFPGLLVLIQALLFYQWFIDPHFWEFLKTNWPTQAGLILVILIMGYAISTILGVILDGVHHFIFEDFLRKKTADQKFCAIKDDFTIEVYKHFLEDDLWYPYEAYANVAWQWSQDCFYSIIGYHLSCILWVGDSGYFCLFMLPFWE